MLNEIQEKVRNELIKIAQKGNPFHTTYQKLSDELRLGYDMTDIGDRNEFGHVLGEISRFEYGQGRRLLSVLVFNDQKNMPGEGFFNLAQEVGELRISANESQKEQFFYEELRKVYKQWSK